MRVYAIRPLRGVPFFEQSLQLGPSQYVLSYAWLDRVPAWSLSLATVSGTVLFSGLIVACNVDLLARYRWHPDCPPGVLMLLDPTEKIDTPGFTELVDQVTLVYAELD